jgi:predicted phosphodiesterase
MSTVMVIGDTHFPAVHPGYYEFIRSMKRKHRPTETIHIGDLRDSHSCMFHARHPEADGAMEEHNKTLAEIRKWKRLFPTLKVCIGNHDERVHRMCAAAGIPKFYLKDYAVVMETPRWEYAEQFVIDGVLYMHGHGRGGGNINPAFNFAKALRMPVVCGHFHTLQCINTARFHHQIQEDGQVPILWGMQVGSGVDENHPAMAYSRSLLRPALGCGIVKDGIPHIERMPNSGP